jgi:hypothetical protein
VRKCARGAGERDVAALSRLRSGSNPPSGACYEMWLRYLGHGAGSILLHISVSAAEILLTLLFGREDSRFSALLSRESSQPERGDKHLWMKMF